MNEETVEKIADILKELKNQDYKKESLVWTFKSDGLKGLVNSEDLEALENASDTYEKNIRLKGILKNYFSDKNDGNNETNRKLAEWIVNDWGGIKSLKDFDKINGDIKLFYTDKEKLGELKLSNFLWLCLHNIMRYDKIPA